MSPEDGSSGVDGIIAEVLLDAKQLVVLGHALAAARRAGLDLTEVQSDDEVGDERVLRLTRSVRDDARVSALRCEPDRVERLRQRPDLVELDQDGVGGARLDSPLQNAGVGDEDIVADDLNPRSESFRHLPPSRPVPLRQTVLDGYDRVAPDEA